MRWFSIITYKNKNLSLFDSILFRIMIKLINYFIKDLIYMLIDNEVVNRRNKLRNQNPDINPLSSEYPDIDTVRKEWGLPTTEDLIRKLAKRF